MSIFHQLPRWINKNGEHQSWRGSSQLSIATSPSSKGYLSIKLCIDELRTLKLNYRSCTYGTVLHLHDFSQSLGIILVFNNSQTYPQHQRNIPLIPWIKKFHFCIIDQMVDFKIINWIYKPNDSSPILRSNSIFKDQIIGL